MKINLGSNGSDGTPRVEVVPLIDVIFCILTFFLLSGLQMARQQAINVDIPKAKTAETQTRQMMIISLDAEGRVFVEQQQYPQLEQLFLAAQAYRSTTPSGSVVLYASKQVRYERVMEILDLLRQAAGENVALATADPALTASPVPSASVLSPGGGLATPSGTVPGSPVPTATFSTSPSIFPLPTSTSR
jgi:biopolymer transport protein ExbD